jgi:flagellar hook-associated protein 1
LWTDGSDVNEFSAIGTALSGMNAAQEELDVTGNNIANQSTTGYVRESVNLTPTGIGVSTLTNPAQGIGTGVQILGVSRADNQYLDLQDLTAHANAAGLNQTQTVLSQAQDAFDEPSSNGLSAQLSSFWSAWDTVANNPTNASSTTALISQAQSLATTFNQTASSLTQVASNATSQALGDVSQINQDAAQVAKLNLQIVAVQANGTSAGGLADQRAALVTQLGELTGATTHANANGSLDLNVGSEALVQGTTANTITGSVAPSGALSLSWNVTGAPVSAGGELGALSQAVNTTMPGYQSQLDASANALATAVNAQLAAGVTWTGVGTAAQASGPGQPLFSGTGAAGLTVSPTLTASQLAVGSATAGPSDGSNAQAIANLGSAPGSADSIYGALVGQVGSDVQTVTTQATTASTIETQADSAQQSVEGVNLDEELANMNQFQNAYTASAEFLNTVNQTIQSLLTMVG